MKRPKAGPSLSVELEKLYGRCFWARDWALNNEGLGELPFALLRQAVLRKRVSLQVARRLTCRPKPDIAKAVKFLVDSCLVKKSQNKRDRRYLSLRPTARGIKRLKKVEQETERRLLEVLEFEDRRDLDRFRKALQKVTALLPEINERIGRPSAVEGLEPTGPSDSDEEDDYVEGDEDVEDYG